MDTIKNKDEKWGIDEKDDLRSAGHRPHICPVCGGKGILQSDFYLIGSLSTSISPVTCRTCGGSGIVWGN